MTSRPAPVAAWHALVESGQPAGLDALLADDCVFRSPAVHRPQEGKDVTKAYLAAALVVLGPSLTYVGEWCDDDSAILEFEAEVDGRTVHGIDMLRWNAAGQLTSFTVMVRPLRGLEAVIAAMGAELTRSAG